MSSSYRLRAIEIRVLELQRSGHPLNPRILTSFTSHPVENQAIVTHKVCNRYTAGSPIAEKEGISAAFPRDSDLTTALGWHSLCTGSDLDQRRKTLERRD